jgi:hypothetical protein
VSGAATLPAGEALRRALVALLLGAAALTAGAAADRQGDFVHLWLGGRLAAAGGGPALYDPVAQRRALDAALGGSTPDRLWAPRNDALGAFFYPPPAALAYAPLGALPLRTAGLLHALLHAAGAAAAGLLLARWAGLRASAGALLVLTCPAAFFGHVLGQNGVWALLLVTAGLLLHQRGRPALGGLLLGLLVAKPHWLVLLAPAALALRSARLAAGATAGAAGAALLSLLLLGPAPWRDWITQLGALAQLSAAEGAPLRLLYGLPSAALRAGAPSWGPAVAGLLPWALAWAWAAARPGPTAAAGAVLLAGLASPHLHPYDVVVAIPALALVCARRPALGLGLAALHHGLLAAEGGGGSGMIVPWATLGLLVALGGLGAAAPWRGEAAARSGWPAGLRWARLR